MHCAVGGLPNGAGWMHAVPARCNGEPRYAMASLVTAHETGRRCGTDTSSSQAAQAPQPGPPSGYPEIVYFPADWPGKLAYFPADVCYLHRVLRSFPEGPYQSACKALKQKWRIL